MSLSFIFTNPPEDKNKIKTQFLWRGEGRGWGWGVAGGGGGDEVVGDQICALSEAFRGCEWDGGSHQFLFVVGGGWSDGTGWSGAVVLVVLVEGCGVGRGVRGEEGSLGQTENGIEVVCC